MNGWEHKKSLCLCRLWYGSNQWGKKEVSVELTFTMRSAFCKGGKFQYFSWGK